MTKPSIICGIDEVGRGPLAGPVVAAAVILPDGFVLDGLTDSKKLSAKKRDALFEVITRDCLYGIGEASVTEIDKINILLATFLAMRRAVDALPTLPSKALIDGNRVPKTFPCPAEAIIKGDLHEPCIAAASIIAKVTRDRMMAQLAKDYPQYGWERNAAYGTKEHLEAMTIHGITAHHRRSFAPVARMLNNSQKVA